MDSNLSSPITQWLDTTYEIVGDLWRMGQKFPKLNPITDTDAISQLTSATIELVEALLGEPGQVINITPEMDNFATGYAAAQKPIHEALKEMQGE